MFNFQSFKPIRFSSNPPLPDGPQVVGVDNGQGNITNKVIYRPRSNESYFKGIHFSAELMSLRAKLGNGNLKYVPNVNINNDPAEVLHTMQSVENDINQRLSDIQNEDHSSLEPVKTE